EGPAARVRHLHDVSRQRSVAIRQVAREDPRVAAGKALGGLPVNPDFVHRMACKRAMRSSVDGCVENRRMSDWPVNGLTMNMWAVEGVASIGMRLDQVSSFCNPPIRG